MNAFITGITGFVGGHLAEHLLAAGDAVMGLSASGTWPEGTPESLLSNVPVFRCDLAEDSSSERLAELRRAFEPDCIYHLAAISVPADCGGDEPTARAIAANVTGTRRLLERSAALGAPRVVFVSTSHVYAPPRSREERRRETDSPSPRNAYGKTKLLAELAVLEAVAAGRADAVIARAFQHTGPRQGPRLMLPEWAQQLALGADPLVVRNRDTWIDLSDVRDVVRAYRLLARHGVAGETYNVASGVSHRTGDILETLFTVAGRRASVTESRPGERFDPIADTSKIQTVTGWRPEITLEQTVRDVYRWYAR